MAEDRSEMQEARAHGLKARHETRETRARLVLGELDHALVIQEEQGFVRLVIADEDGEHHAAIRLAPAAAERAIRVLMRTVGEIGSRDPE